MGLTCTTGILLHHPHEAPSASASYISVGAYRGRGLVVELRTVSLRPQKIPSREMHLPPDGRVGGL